MEQTRGGAIEQADGRTAKWTDGTLERIDIGLTDGGWKRAEGGEETDRISNRRR